MSYFKDIQSGIRTTLKGLSLTWRHLRQATHRRTPEGVANANYFDVQNGLVTLQYPHEQLPIPDNGRYRLRNEIEDCIVCDKCAKICPVDCITIDPIKATEEVGRASDGSPIRLYAAKFDIDMAKCCYCGLCTVVCPTECLTMDKKFDYSEFELGRLTYSFAELTPEQADEKRALYEQFVREKEEAKAAQVVAKTKEADTSPEVTPVAKRPVFRPTAKPVVPPAKPANSEGSSIEHPLTDAKPDEMQKIAQGGLETTKRPVFKPTQKPAKPAPEISLEDKGPKPQTPVVKAAPPAFRPTMKPGTANSPKDEPHESEEAKAVAQAAAEEPKAKEVVPRPAFRPTMKPSKPAALATDSENAGPELSVNTEQDKPKPGKTPAAFRPTMKPKSPPESTEPMQVASADKISSEPVPDEPTKPKTTPAPFRPTMKPKPVPPKPGDGEST